MRPSQRVMSRLGLLVAARRSPFKVEVHQPVVAENIRRLAQGPSDIAGKSCFGTLVAYWGDACEGSALKLVTTKQLAARLRLPARKNYRQSRNQSLFFS